MTVTARWMQLEIIILSEVGQKEKDKCHMILHLWNLKYDTNESMKQKQNQRHRE